ncbi:type II secretion system protein [Ramlibacter sp. AN1133]|uniref:type II secretion system protein n=1 Tax=Ramlibacter sp. AN1133 TaxID=3133429 RepID=UPI0030BAFE2D
MARSRESHARGFMLVELIVGISLSALLAMYLSAQLRQQSEDSLAEGAATYIGAVASAAQQHVLLNWASYANGTAVPGIAVLLQPTVAELVSLGRLNPGFPSGSGALPTRQSLQVSITRNSCPGPTCQVQVLACTTTPVTLGSPDTRFDLASLMTSRQGGSGGQSLQNFGSTIRGPALSVPNPVGNVEGIVCGSGSVDTALFERFLVLNETRDPNFQGPVTIAGATTLKGTLAVSGAAAVNGNTSVGGCAQIRAATGRAAFGCANPDELPAGYAGGVSAPDVVVGGNILASTDPAGFTGANGIYAYVGVGGGVAEVRTSGRAQADRLVPSGLYALNGACAAGDEGAIARDSAGSGLLTCRGSLWRSLANYSGAGASCNLPNGSIADDGTGAKLLCINGIYVSMASLRPLATAGAACGAAGTAAYDPASSNEMLVCRLNPAGGVPRWMRLRDLTSNLQFVQSYEVTDVAIGPGGQVTKPVCSPAAGMAATPLIQLVPKTYASADGGIAAYAVDTGVVWQIFLRNGSGGLLTGNPNARSLANVFCFYA